MRSMHTAGSNPDIAAHVDARVVDDESVQYHSGMSENDESDAYLEAASRFLDLPIRPEHRADVIIAFNVLVAFGRLVTEFKLDEQVEAAPRYRP
jgi:hypothetical protein